MVFFTSVESMVTMFLIQMTTKPPMMTLMPTLPCDDDVDDDDDNNVVAIPTLQSPLCFRGKASRSIVGADSGNHEVDLAIV